MSPTGRETGHEYVQVGRDGFVFLKCTVLLRNRLIVYQRT